MSSDLPDGIHVTLAGHRVLLVEDEYFIADDVRRVLKRAGAEIVGPVGTLTDAAEALDAGGFECAVLDLNLHGESAVPIADRLLAEGKSFAIATGYGDAAVPEHLAGIPRIEKPFDPESLLQLVAQLSCARIEPSDA